MLTFSLMEPEGILRMQPHGPLTQADFAQEAEWLKRIDLELKVS